VFRWPPYVKPHPPLALRTPCSGAAGEGPGLRYLRGRLRGVAILHFVCTVRVRRRLSLRPSESVDLHSHAPRVRSPITRSSRRVGTHFHASDEHTEVGTQCHSQWMVTRMRRACRTDRGRRHYEPTPPPSHPIVTSPIRPHVPTSLRTSAARPRSECVCISIDEDSPPDKHRPIAARCPHRTHMANAGWLPMVSRREARSISRARAEAQAGSSRQRGRRSTAPHHRLLGHMAIAKRKVQVCLSCRDAVQ
jgi:hypothetical protein